MNIKIRKIGEVLSDGSILINKKLFKIFIFSKGFSKTNPVLSAIERRKTITYGRLLNNLSYKMRAKEVQEHLKNLIQEGLIEEVIERGKKAYIRTQKVLIESTESELDNGLKLTEAEKEEQLNYPIKKSKLDIWVYRNMVLHLEYDDYLNEMELNLHIKRYVLNQEKQILEIKQEISNLTKALKEGVGKREPIPGYVRVYVWQRDGGQCVKCGSKENLQFDHIIPVSKGGGNTGENIQILCEKCNREKRDKI